MDYIIISFFAAINDPATTVRTKFSEASQPDAEEASNLLTRLSESIGEAMHIYCNQRTVHSVETLVDVLKESQWPLPLFVDPAHIKVGFWNRYALWRWGSRGKLRPYNWIYALHLSKISKFHATYSEAIIEMHDANRSFIKQRLLNNPFFTR